jgi:hypothetical protein
LTTFFTDFYREKKEYLSEQQKLNSEQYEKRLKLEIKLAD